MNYSLYNIPYSGERPIVFMDITLNDQSIGRIQIKLFREVFPAAVENFVKISEGNTFRTEKRAFCNNRVYKETRRSYSETVFHKFFYENYLIGGDIYSNTGSNAGTIYSDFPIPDYRSESFYPHERKGMISLVPFVTPGQGLGEPDRLYYDSTFIILLDDINPTNAELYNALDSENIVIGYVYSGLDVIDKINNSIAPRAGRQYPRIGISLSGVFRPGQSNKPAIPKKALCGGPCNRNTRCRLKGRRNILPSDADTIELLPAPSLFTASDNLTMREPLPHNYQISAQNAYNTTTIAPEILHRKKTRSNNIVDILTEQIARINAEDYVSDTESNQSDNDNESNQSCDNDNESNQSYDNESNQEDSD